MNAALLAESVQAVTDCVGQVLTKHADAVLLVGGDFNKKDISSLLSAHPCLLPTNAGATRNGEKLDEIYSNMSLSVEEKLIQKPLSKLNGVESDHSIITVSIKLPKSQRSVASVFNFRPITTKGVEKFEKLIVPFDWECIRMNNPSDSAAKLDDVLQSFIAQCFPEKTRKIRSNDAPWLDKKTKKLLDKKRRIYKKEGKSDNYFIICAECEVAVRRAKEVFIDKIIEKKQNC